MLKQVLKNAKCAKCGEKQEFLVLDNFDFESEKNNVFIDFSTYSAFKNPCINVCQNCGYINFDLSENQIPFATFDKKQIISENGLVGIDAIYELYASKSPLNLKYIQTISKIFDLHQYSYGCFLSKNFRKTSENLENLENLHKLLVSKFIETCELFLKFNSNNFAKCFYVELLAEIGKSEQAKQVFDTLNLSEDLKEYLLERIEIGGKK